MTHGKSMGRRDFIKLSSVALGGIILTGCGGGSGSGQLPNGHRYYCIKNLHDQVDPQGRAFLIEEFLGSVYISSNGIISFDAVDGDKRRGVFQLGVDFFNDRPTIIWERSALLTGDELNDGRVVSTWGNYDVDEWGNIGALIDADHGRSSANHFGTGLYLDKEQSGFNPLLVSGQEFGDGTIRSSGIFYCASIRNGNLLAALNHLPTESHRGPPRDSLLYIPGGETIAANLLISRGDYLSGTDYRIHSFGLLDHNQYGDYCATVFTTAPPLLTAEKAASPAACASFNFMARVDAVDDHVLVTASHQAALNDIVVRGEAGYAPRIGPDGDTYVPLRDNDRMVLVRNDEALLATGNVTAVGKIVHIGTGSVGEDGHYYYAIRTDSIDWVLMAYDGVNHLPLLTSGDILSPGGAPVSRILFGTTKRHVDNAGRLAFICTFTDGSMSLVVGIPS